MDRNLDRRVEALVEVRDDAAKAELDEVLSMAWSAQVDHWWLASDGIWERATGEGLIDHQEAMIARMVGERGDTEDEGG
jgi:polyphosphate kinase